ncbi:MAG: hypothetical protein A3I00_08920 [Betaproteobacteria bacterium RIFCSPLOWO2_02_FULL_64_12]|nr:MAG: hypothetical protein A3I00_08920 [Betaproteobacteria bacterium RIFCSPLOWO2_02_FULL_64_12]
MSEAITFWLGCNVLRHGDIVHACVDILRALGVDAKVVGGPDYCCGSVKDANLATEAGMAKRTAQNMAAAGRARVVAWCPSCHAQMNEVISRAHQTPFSIGHFAELLLERRAELAKLLAREVPLRVMLHEHHAYDRRVPINAILAELLALIPGVTVLQGSYRAPGYMCSPLAAMPPLMERMCGRTVAQARSLGADALVTIYHQCHRELVGLDVDGHLPVHNYVQLMARSMGIGYADEYRAWKAAGSGAKPLLGEARIAAVGEALVDRALLPEFARRPWTPKR